MVELEDCCSIVSGSAILTFSILAAQTKKDFSNWTLLQPYILSELQITPVHVGQ